MRLYNGKVKPERIKADKTGGRNSFINFVLQADKRIEAWVNHLISEIDCLKENNTKKVEGLK